MDLIFMLKVLTKVKGKVITRSEEIDMNQEIRI